MEAKVITHRHSKGYILQKAVGHPKAHRGFVLQHVLVAEKALGRYLVYPEQVHHLTADKTDNKNLVICPDAAYHRLLDIRTRAFLATGDPTAKHCKYCHRYDRQDEFVVYKGCIAHRQCKNSKGVAASRKALNTSP